MAEQNQTFETFERWVNKASSWLTRREGKAICYDTKGRQCMIGRDFMQARDDGSFPVRWVWDWQVAEFFAAHPMTVLTDSPTLSVRLVEDTDGR